MDVVELDDGRYRMYMGDVPGLPGFKHAVYSAISSDGKSWQQEDGTRQANATFPDVIRLKDGRWRMYYQGADSINSAVSNDGLSWTDEAGVRIDTADSEGLSLSRVAASTTIQKDDGTFIMVYRGTIEKQYANDVPNKITGVFLWATSQDGLTFEKKGLAIDSRNETYVGHLDGPDWVKWDDGQLRLYYWGYKGIYYAAFDGSTFDGNKLTMAAAGQGGSKEFPPDPPGDPSLIKIDGTWFMYYAIFSNNEDIVYYVTKN